MTIREADESDLSILEALLPRAYSPILAQLLADDASILRANIIDGVKKYAEKGKWFIAEREGQPIGCVAYFSPFSTEHPLFQGNCSHVQLLGVLPDAANRGLGRALMLRCIAASKYDRAVSIALRTSAYMSAARHLYETLGFHVDQELPPLFGKPTYLYIRTGSYDAEGYSGTCR